MQRYDTYKDSGVKWLGVIPSHWEVKRLKNVVSYNDDVLLETEKKDKHIKYVEISDVDSVSGIKQYSEYDFKDAPSRARRVTRKGDVIVSTVRTYLRAVAQIDDDDLIVSTGFAVLRAKKIDKRFLAYYILSDSFISEVIRRSVGTSYPAINANELASIYLICPPNNEQTAIANYLDTATAKIDAAIAQQQKMIDLLNERKQIIINRAVTKGLNPNAKMKDSGVEWIGEVPEGWRPITLKRLFVSRVAGSWGEDENTNSMNSICLRIADFNYNTLSFKIKEDYTIRSYSSAEVEKKHLHGGDVLIEKSGGGEKTPVGRCVLYDLDLDKPMYANFMEKLSCRSFVNPKYIVYLMSSLYSAGVVWPYIKATTGIQNLDITSLLSREVVFIPSLREQEQIVELLKDRTRLLLNAIESCYNQISLLQERKQIVINEVVTGKVKVI